MTLDKITVAGVALVLVQLACWPAAAAAAGEVQWKVHALNADSQHSACVAFDVNHDGLLDVVAGGWWYEAPTWKRHFVRDVEFIGGRYDGYSHLPMDVNGDGWLDVVNVNYRSKAIYWVQHPGPPAPGKEMEPWTKHIVAEPGPMETGRLYDVDGDGKLDILPNGVQFAAWWELKHDKTASGAIQPRWIRHDLPKDVAAHGVGFGDVNGDGRGDVVGPKGWLEAPVDRRKGTWTWHPDFELSPDASVPILVVDVDGDGDNDIVWGRGHNYGVYWLEHEVSAAAKHTWTRHEIDKSWSQAHALLWADVDGDGHGDLIAGKRYMAHDGKDPGANDPLGVYWYGFDRGARKWQRHTISSGGHVGFGLDPQAVDLDGDGDLDVVCPGRSGLYWAENLRVRK